MSINLDWKQFYFRRTKLKDYDRKVDKILPLNAYLMIFGNCMDERIAGDTVKLSTFINAFYKCDKKALEYDLADIHNYIPFDKKKERLKFIIWLFNIDKNVLD